jgi:hypothetical protein
VRFLLVCALALSLLGAGVTLVPRSNGANAAPNTFVTMPDGVQIALNVRLPDDYVDGRRYPTLFEMSGYDGGSAEDGTLARDFMVPQQVPGVPRGDSRQLTRRFNRDYVTVHASVRGTGCSGGEFDLFSTQSADDGKYVIDEWIAEQPWSNGDVAIMGHSYSGITGFLVATRRPTHLRAITVSGLIDDLYRGIVYPGGVSNYGFPLLWTGAYRPVNDVGGGVAPGVVRPEQADDAPGRRSTCTVNQALKSRTVTNEPLVQGLADTDNDWYRSRSLITYVRDIAVPIHITGAYQDEQTGPRGFTHLWEKVRGVPKRLVVTNGNHNTQNPSSTGPEVWGDRKAWIDHWMGVEATPELGRLRDDRPSVHVLFEYHRDAAHNGMLVSNGHLEGGTFPLEATRWGDLYLREDGALSTDPPSAPPGDAGASDAYVSGSVRQSWNYQAGPQVGPPLTTADGPDELVYRSAALDRPVTIAGPATATLFVRSSAPDTDLFVQLVDEAPDGSRSYLQRGLLRASHRAVDTARSDAFAGRIYRPWRPHVNPTPITPGETYEYLVEIFPVAHVFRPGHRIVVKVHTPPLVDSIYAYVPERVPGVNTVLRDAGHASRVTLPIVPTPWSLGAELPCGAQEAVRCIAP